MVFAPKLKHSTALILAMALLTGCQTSVLSSDVGAQATVPPVELSKLPPDPKPPATDADLAARLVTLEKSVHALQQQFDKAKPSIEKMEAAERQFRALSLELDRISNTYGIARASAAAPAVAASATAVAPPVMARPVISPQDINPPKPTTKPKQAVKAQQDSKPVVQKQTVQKPAAPAAKVSVQDIRLGGQQNGKTRVVLDLSGPGTFSYDLDAQEKILVIELKNATASASLQKAGLSSPLVQSYSVQNDGNDARIILQLKDGATVTGSSSLAPSGGAGHRVYVDLAKG